MSTLFGDLGPIPVTEFDALVARCRENLKAGRMLLAGLSPAEAEAVQTRYASFDDTLDREGFLTASEVVLRTPRTPRPFVHILSTNHYELFNQWASFWDQNGGAIAFAAASSGRPCLRISRSKR